MLLQAIHQMHRDIVYDYPESVEACWLDAGPMRWSGFGEIVNKQLLRAAGFRVVESEAIRQIEPDGCEIVPMWFVGERIATRVEQRKHDASEHERRAD